MVRNVEAGMKKRMLFVGVLGIVVVFAGLRGCGDFTKPVPWAPEARSSVSAIPPVAG
jgi:hypothetical protein